MNAHSGLIRPVIAISTFRKRVAQPNPGPHCIQSITRPA
jgi:hypothetical protein